MHRSSILACVFSGLLLSLASASAQEIAKLSEFVSGMPKGEKQQIRVLPPSNPATRLFSILTVSQ